MFQLESGIIIWTSISFVLLLGLLYKVALPPLLDIMEKRQGHIEEIIKHTEENHRQSEELLASYNTRLKEIEQRAGEIMERTKGEAENIRKHMLKQTEEEADSIRQQIKMETAAEKSKALDEMKKELSDFVFLAISKVLGRAITPEDRERLVKEGIDEIKRV